MQKFLFFFGLILFAQSGIFAQCLSQPVCPGVSQTFCDSTENNIFYWKDSLFFDPAIQSHDLGETPTGLSMQLVDTCGAGGVQVSFVLLLDLNGDGVRETAISSDSLPGAGLVYYGNAANPNYTGGEARLFDTRAIPNDQKYRFVLEKIVQDSLVTVRVRWVNAENPNDYVLPELPYGAHRMEWRFVKNGEVKTCGYDFVVKDCKPPTVTCVNGLTITNLPNCLIELWATDFFLSSSLPTDNYTPANLLQFGIRRSGTGTGFPANSPGVMFTAYDLGTQSVELWVKDLAGNANYCETYVIIQDNSGSCDPFFNANLEVCAVNHCNREGVTEVTFNLSGSNPATPPFMLFGVGSDSTGCYTFNNSIPLASNLTVTPTKDDNPLNGVSTYDLVLISKHILGIEPLGSPYKMIAADANRSGSITAFDIVELRKLILGVYQELPNNTSWRFVDSSFVFPNPSNPFQTAFPENAAASNIQTNFATFFYGIKIGDVNCNAISNFTQTPREEALIIPDLHLQANDAVEVPVRFSEADGYQGFQFGLHFDPTQIEVLEIIPEIGTKDNFGLFPDQVNVSWSDVHTALFLPDEPVFRLRIKALVPLQLAKVLSLNTKKLHAEAYSDSDNPINLRLQFATTTEPDAAQTIFDPTPNPTIAGVRIPLRLEKSETVAVELLNATGQLLYQQEQTRNFGAQWLELPATAFPQAGVYIWRVQVGAASRSGKIIRQ